jgi:hypothetical protein
VNKSGIEPKVR